MGAAFDPGHALEHSMKSGPVVIGFQLPGQEAPSTHPTFDHGQGISIPQDEQYLKMELPLLSTKVTSLSPAKTKKDLVNLQKKNNIKKTSHPP